MEIGDFFVFQVDTKVFVSLLNSPTCWELFQIDNIVLFLSKLVARDYITDCEGNGYNIRMIENTYTLSHHPGTTCSKPQNNTAILPPMTKKDRKKCSKKYKFKRDLLLSLVHMIPMVYDKKQVKLNEETNIYINELQNEIDKLK